MLCYPVDSIHPFMTVANDSSVGNGHSDYCLYFLFHRHIPLLNQSKQFLLFDSLILLSQFYLIDQLNYLYIFANFTIYHVLLILTNIYTNHESKY